MSDPVQDLINSKQIPFSISGRDYLVKCLNPEHDDSNPSMRIDRISGAYHCFACGFKGNIFKFYGLLTNNIPIKIAKLKEKIKELKMSSSGVPMPKGSIAFSRSFRGISPATLKEFGAFYTTQEEKLEDRIVFPIKDITGKTVVYVGRHTLSNGNPRYVNYPTGAIMPLFPASLPRGEKSLVLVEGLFDMLNCYDKGLRNVVTTFGTNTLQKDTKQKLLPFKAQGVTKVYIMFDGDEAGGRAATALKPLIEECEFEVEIINLPEGTDPGNLDEENLLSIKEYTA